MTLESDFDTLLHDAGLCLLPDRAFLRVSGSEAIRWLNGMVTNSIQGLGPGQGNYNFLLNAQGRIQGDCHIYRYPAEGQAIFLLATEAAQMAVIHPMLDRYIIMDDVELEPVLAGDESLLLAGPASEAHLAQFGVSVPAASSLRIAATPDGELLLLSEHEAGVPRLEFRAKPPVIAALRTALAAIGVAEVSPEALEALRLWEGRPRFGTDIRERDLPQETGQAHALHFSKGCYLGQEIVERIHSRGQVHRMFTRLELDGALPASFPAPLEANGKSAGEITSAGIAPLPDGPKRIGLGYVRREALDLKQPLTYPDGAAVPRS